MPTQPTLMIQREQQKGCAEKHPQHYPTKAVPNARSMAEQQS